MIFGSALASPVCFPLSRAQLKSSLEFLTRTYLRGRRLAWLPWHIYPPSSRLDFFGYSLLSFGIQFIRLLAGQHGASSQRQYDSYRTAFMLFLLVKEVHGINRETFAAFMRFLFLFSD